MTDRQQDGHKPETAADEIVEEARKAELRLPGQEPESAENGEAGDALSPNTAEQEEIHRGDPQDRAQPTDRRGHHG